MVSCILVSFFQGLSLALSTETKSSVFSFCLTFSVSMELGETSTYCSLEGMSLCGNKAIQSACAQLLWGGGEAGSGVNTVTPFPRMCSQLLPW